MSRFALCTVALAVVSLAFATSCQKKEEPSIRPLRLPATAPVAAAAAPNTAVAATSAATPAPAELELRAALEIVGGDADLQPSGLALYGSKLVMVSDKHDNVVFELELGQTQARLRPFVWFEPPSGEPAPLDYEGISVDAGRLLIASESRFRVLSVELPDSWDKKPRAPTAKWLTPSLRELGQAAGLFAISNAYLEGLVALPKSLDSGLLLAAEREPRGLIELRSWRALEGAGAWNMSWSVHPVPPGREPDFADLAHYFGSVYALVRNGHLIVELGRGPEGWKEQRAWSYARTENDPRYVYEDTRFGLAEGLAMDQTTIYVALDNNGQARRAPPKSRRPLLFLFERPQN